MPASKEKTKFYIQWHLSDRCNLRCKHCYVSERKTHLPLPKLKDGIDNVLRPVSNWVDEISVCLSGGEPFLYPDLAEIVLHLKKWKKVKKIMFTSNGTLADKKLLGKIGKHIDNIQISLEGGKEANDQIRGGGVYDLVKKNIPVYRSLGCKIAVNMTVHKLNYKEIPAVIKFCEDNKVDIFAISRLVPIGSNNEVAKLMLSKKQTEEIYSGLVFLSKKKKLKFSFNRTLWNIIDKKIGHPCSVGLNAVAILADGTLLPCRRLEIPIGNFLNGDFVDVWLNSPVLNKLRDRGKIKKCGSCEHLEKCGGCRAVAYGKTGDLLSEDPQCFKL
ncbi:MAG: radical SAM protein [Candidatus Paceibacterota bacterium]|jgi:radical SAM protein with 4Fe4S-binding SPASM domain